MLIYKRRTLMAKLLFICIMAALSCGTQYGSSMESNTTVVTYADTPDPIQAIVTNSTPYILSEQLYTQNVGTFKPPQSLINELSSGNVINVKSFGAQGNDINDDSQCIEKALNQAKDSTTKTVYFPQGTYKVTKDFDLNDEFSGIRILGLGSDSVIKLYGDTCGNIFTISDYLKVTNKNITNIEIGYLKIVGNRGASQFISGFGIDTFMKGTATINNLNIHDIDSSNFITNGIQIENSYDTRINNIRSHDNGCHGVGIKVGTYDIGSIWAFNNIELGVDFSFTGTTIAYGKANKLYLYNNTGGGGKTAGLWNVQINNLITINNGGWGFYKTRPVNKLKIGNFISKNNKKNGLYFGACDGTDQLEINYLNSTNDNLGAVGAGGAVYIPSNAKEVFINDAIITEANIRALTIESPNVSIGNLYIYHTKTTSDYPVRIQAGGGGNFENVYIYNGDNVNTAYGMFVETSKDVTINMIQCGDTRATKYMTRGMIIANNNTGYVKVSNSDFSDCLSTGIYDMTDGSKTQVSNCIGVMPIK